MLAMDVNEDAGNLIPRGAVGLIASMLAPTEGRCRVEAWWHKKRPRKGHFPFTPGTHRAFSDRSAVPGSRWTSTITLET